MVLSRSCGESIIINNDIVVTLVDIRGDKVRLGITAPREIPVHRSEIHEAILRDQKKSSIDDDDLTKPVRAYDFNKNMEARD